MSECQTPTIINDSSLLSNVIKKPLLLGQTFLSFIEKVSRLQTTKLNCLHLTHNAKTWILQ